MASIAWQAIKKYTAQPFLSTFFAFLHCVLSNAVSIAWQAIKKYTVQPFVKLHSGQEQQQP